MDTTQTKPGAEPDALESLLNASEWSVNSDDVLTIAICDPAVRERLVVPDEGEKGYIPAAEMAAALRRALTPEADHG